MRSTLCVGGSPFSSCPCSHFPRPSTHILPSSTQLRRFISCSSSCISRNLTHTSLLSNFEPLKLSLTHATGGSQTKRFSLTEKPLLLKLDHLRAFRSQRETGEKRSLSPRWLENMKRHTSGKRGRSPLPDGASDSHDAPPLKAENEEPGSVIPGFLCMAPSRM